MFCFGLWLHWFVAGERCDLYTGINMITSWLIVAIHPSIGTRDIIVSFISIPQAIGSAPLILTVVRDIIVSFVSIPQAIRATL